MSCLSMLSRPSGLLWVQTNQRKLGQQLSNGVDRDLSLPAHSYPSLTPVFG